MMTRNALRRLGATLALGVVAHGATAHADVLFADNFDRTNSRNIDASLDGIIDNTGSALPVDGVYSTPWIDPTNDPGPQDGNAANGGGSQVLDNQLQLAVGAGTSNAFVNHNFINPEILAAGGFTVSLDVLGYAGTSEGQGGAFAIGMSQAEAAAANDGFTGAPNNVKFTNAFPQVFANTKSDFWIGLRGDANQELAWGHGPVGIGDLGTGFFVSDVDAKTGTIAVTFLVSSFDSGSSVDYQVFFNGTSQGTGSFNWSESNANYIGIDSRDGTAVVFDNFVISTAPEPTTLASVAVICLFAAARRARQAA
ncbi:hypothetical protein [Botrimarina mediterranea]|uniref:hypothetical protein n=1 Tax=Botrimarina mediterranea TaxID=2528022 RepID=UPI00118C222E|nr:hypothetical protein K2D_22070 [Planctomycetes bacterium K2D]